MAQLDTRIPDDIQAVLSRLRRRIRQYVFFEGAALVVVLLAALFWLSLGLEWSYFQVRRLELPIWFRKFFGLATLGLFVAGLLTWVVFRVLRTLRTRALALVLERRFPELDDRLMTAVELAESHGGSLPELTSAMLRRTVADAVRLAGSLPLSSVFEKRPLVRAATTATVLVALIGGFWATNAEAMQHWADAYLKGWFGEWREEYRPRSTRIVVRVLAQPNDRVKDFRDAAGEPTGGLPGTYKHPRGGDLTLLVEVAEGTAVPESVELSYDLDGGRGGARAPLSKSGDRQYRHTISGVLDSLEFHVRGGDFANRRPYRVEVVDPPQVESIVLDCFYPEYTGLNTADEKGARQRDPKPVQGTTVGLPVGTDFVLRAKANKRLTAAFVQAEHWSVTVDRSGARLSLGAAAAGGTAREVPLPAEFVAPFPADGGTEFRIPFVLVSDAAERLPAWTAGVGTGIPIAPDSALRIYLDDVDEISGTDPARLVVGGLVDAPPEIETQLRGIGTSITRKASIPVAGTILDDYGIESARFEFKVDDGTEWRVRPFRVSPQGRPREFRLEREPGEAVERYEVTPLDLALGQKLVLVVVAADADDLHGPHATRGERYEFKIVSNEELLSLLYVRELNLRLRVEQIVKELVDTKKDLDLQKIRADALLAGAGGKPAEGAETPERMRAALASSAERALHQLRKNANETASVEASLGEILEELVNNAVHTRQMVDRIDGLIMKPLHAIVVDEFPAADQAVALFRLDNEKGLDPRARIERSADAVQVVVDRLRTVLKEMADLVEFHEALKDLKSIIEEEQKLQEETKTRQKRELLEKLKGLQD